MPILYGRRYVLPLLAQLLRQHPALNIEVRMHDGIDLDVRMGELRDSSLGRRGGQAAHRHDRRRMRASGRLC